MADSKTLNNLMVPKLSDYIPHTPTEKQQAFLWLNDRDVFYGGQVGGGKALSNDSYVYTPFGPRKIENVEVGNKVCHPSGGISQVIGVYPQGEQKLYRISFKDGSSTMTTAGHIWKYCVSGKGKWKSGLSWKLALTYQLEKMIEDGREILIPLTKPVQFTKSYRYDLKKIHPYMLGVFLGDGGVYNQAVKYSKPDIEILEKLKSLAEYDWSSHKDQHCILGEGRKEFIYWWNKNGLEEARSHNKFIPEQYKYDSVENRLELLRGLMDTDGYCSEDGKAYYTSVSKQLTEDAKWLVTSLGGRATITDKPGKYKDKNGIIVECQTAYTLYIRMPDNADIFFLPRKKERAGKYNAGRMELKRKIDSIREVGTGGATCIKIDHPDGLFLTDDFIVTHNSDALLMAALQYVDVPGYNALLIRDTYQNLSKPDSLMFRASEWLTNTNAKSKDGGRLWHFPSGATLSFGYLDSPMDHFNYMSAAYQFVGIDEAVSVRENQALFLFSRMRKTMEPELQKVPIRFRCASNPPLPEQQAKGKWVKKRYVDPLTKNPDSIFIPSGLSDNPYLDAEEYRKSLAFLDPISRKILEKGNWNSGTGETFFETSKIEIVQPDQFPIAFCHDIVRRWDLAATEEPLPGVMKDPDYTVGAKMGIVDGILYVLDVQRGRWGAGKVPKIIKQQIKLDGQQVRQTIEQEGGATGKIAINMLVDELPGYSVMGVPSSGKKFVRAKPLASWISQGRVRFIAAPWNQVAIDELAAFSVDEREYDHDDIVDTLSGGFSDLGGVTNSGLTEVYADVGVGGMMEIEQEVWSDF